MKIVRFTLVIALALALALLLALQSPVMGQSMNDAARVFVEKRYVHGVPYGEAHALGPQALPDLIMLLADENLKPYWSNIVTTIGYIGSPEGYKTLHDFVWERFNGEVDLTTFQAVIAAQRVMGHIAAFNAPEVLQELERGVNPSYWSSLPWTYRHWRGFDLRVLWSKLSINAISYTGTARASKVLAELNVRPYSEKQRSNIQEGLIRNEQVARMGIEGFERARATRDGGN